MNRYNSNHYHNAENNDKETTSDFQERYKDEMKAVQSKIKKRTECSLYLHDEINLRYRMLFIDDLLYLSKFADRTASQSEVIKIPKGYALYAVCEDHYNQILTNAVPQ